MQKIKDTKSYLFEYLMKVDKSSAGWINKKEEKPQIKIRIESRNITTELTEIKRIEIKYYERVYANKLDKIDE